MGFLLFVNTAHGQNKLQLKDARTGAIIPTSKLAVANRTAKVSTTAFSSSTAGTTVQTLTSGAKKSDLKRNISQTSVNRQETATPSTTMGCVTKRVKAEVGMKDMAIFTPMPNIYPFSIIDGKTILTGAYATKTFKRNPIAIYSDLPVANPNDVGVVVQEPNALNIQSAIRTLIQKPLSGPQPARVSSSVKEIESLDELKLSLNVHAEGFWKAKIDNNFSFSESKSSYTFVAEFEQLYYSINVNDIPSNAKDVFAENIGEIPNDWVYVSSMTFGRKAVLAIVVNNVTRDVANSLKVSINAGIKKIEVGSDLELKKALKNTTISGFIFGGNPNQAVDIPLTGTPDQVIASLKKYITEGAVFDKNNPGAPLYYTLNFLNDNAVCGVYQTLDKNIQKCQDAFRFRVKANRIQAYRTDDGKSFGHPTDRKVEIYGCLAMQAFCNSGAHFYESITQLPNNPVPTELTPNPNDMVAIWRIAWKSKYFEISQGQTFPVHGGIDRVISIPRKDLQTGYFTLVTDGNYTRGSKPDMGINEADDGDDDDWPLNVTSFSRVNFRDVFNQKKLEYGPIFETPGNKVQFFFDCEYLPD